jgi:predicted nucleic acid-binding protein
LSNIWECVYVPQEVWDEINVKTFIPHSILQVVEAPCNVTHQALSLILDAGESAAIALAHRDTLLLIIDEKKGRKWAKNIGVQVIGLIGIVLINIERSLITARDARVIIHQCDEVGFRISASVKERVEMEIKRYE